MHTRHWITLGLVLALSLPTVAAAGEAEDMAMASQIANTIRDSGQLQNFRIGVRFEDGNAVLLGEVTDRSQAEAAMRIANQLPGVKNVKSELEFTKVSPAANAMHFEAVKPQQNENFSEEAGLLLSLPGDEQKIIQTHVTKPGKRGLKPSKRIAKPSKQVAKPSKQVAKQLKKPTRTPNLEQIASAPAPAKVASRMPAPLRRVAASNQLPRPVAYRGPAQRPVQPVAYGGGGARPAGYHPGAGGAGAGSPNLPGYAWPSYAAPQNYSALTYPKQYSPTAWPYIGPFYPYPQVPLGWRKVALEWDDGWWFLDFSHHQSH